MLNYLYFGGRIYYQNIYIMPAGRVLLGGGVLGELLFSKKLVTPQGQSVDTQKYKSKLENIIITKVNRNGIFFVGYFT
jgi:hypothetical protein